MRVPTALADRARHVPRILGVALLLLVVCALPLGAASAEPGTPRISLTEITPSTVTSASGDTIQVRGRIVNTLGKQLSHLRLRLQRGDAVGSAVALRTSLMAATGFPVSTAPREISAVLPPGATADFELTVGVSAADGLRLQQTGVYPLQVSAVGSVDGAAASLLAESRTLLPVLSLPADAQRAQSFVDPGWGGGDPRLARDGSLAPDSSAPAALTMIWPLAAPPQLAPGILGGNTEPVRLISDQLATSLRPDGRLGNQLASLEKLAAANDPRLREAFCLAVDPDLLVTVNAMRYGYLVTTDPANPRAATTPGSGQAVAKEWLNRLREIVPKLCVTALPFAQAGLESLYAIGDTQVSASALTGASDVVDSFLDVKSVRGMVLPATGTLTPVGRELLSTNQLSSVGIASSSIAPREMSTTGHYRTGAVTAATYDAPISAALGATGTRPAVPQIVPNWQRPDLAGESAVSRRQAALGALAFPMLAVPDPAGAQPVTGRSAFVMPPSYWAPTVDDAQALFDTTSLLLASGTARPAPLGQLVGQLSRPAAPAETGYADLVTPGDIDPEVARGYPLTADEAAQVKKHLALSRLLEGSLVGSRDTVTTPQIYLTPLTEDALRESTTPAGEPIEALVRARAASNAAVGSTLDRMKRSVALLDPGGRYTLASERSPLLLVVRNDLALPMRVRMDIDAPAALNVGDVGVQEIPPLGTRQIQIPMHAATSEKATVSIAMFSSTGISLSDPITLSVYTNAYGKPLFWITVVAGIALVLLTARRLWHRFRGQPDPADEDRPEPDENELRLASTPYEDRLEVARDEHVTGPEHPAPEAREDR